MNLDPNAGHNRGHGHSQGHVGHVVAELPHARLRDYAIGFALSVILTATPFWLVMTRPLSAGVTVAIIMIFALVQVVVHMVYFLHMSPKAEGGWSLTSLIFAIIVVLIMLCGSLWVMYHLNANMMPMPHDMRQMP